MRLIAILLVLQLAIAPAARACADYTFRPVFAVARIRDPGGHWRAATIEAADKKIRIEADSAHTPWGRLVVSGDVETGRAIVFSVPVRSPVPSVARVVWRTSLADALPELGITDQLLIAPYGEWMGTRGVFEGHPCNYLDGGEDGFANHWSCASEMGLPLFLRAANGQMTYRVVSFEKRAIDPGRFLLPSGYTVQDRKPNYLTSYDC